MRNANILLLILLSLMLLGACAAKEPEGPGEQIGKGIDLITKGLGSIDEEGSAAAKLEREKLERERKEEIRNRERSRDQDLGHEPYYDSQPEGIDNSHSNDDWSSERRY